MRKLQELLVDEIHIPCATKFGDIITADHKVLNDEGESRSNHMFAPWYKTWPLHGFEASHAQHMRQKKRREIDGRFPIQEEIHRLYVPTTHWDLDKLVKSRTEPL